LKKAFGEELGNLVLYREFSDEHPFPEAGSGKRDFGLIESMGIENTFKINSSKSEIIEKNTFNINDLELYLDNNNETVEETTKLIRK